MTVNVRGTGAGGTRGAIAPQLFVSMGWICLWQCPPPKIWQSLGISTSLPPPPKKKIVPAPLVNVCPRHDLPWHDDWRAMWINGSLPVWLGQARARAARGLGWAHAIITIGNVNAWHCHWHYWQSDTVSVTHGTNWFLGKVGRQTASAARASWRLYLLSVGECHAYCTLGHHQRQALCAARTVRPPAARAKPAHPWSSRCEVPTQLLLNRNERTCHLPYTRTPTSCCCQTPRILPPDPLEIFSYVLPRQLHMTVLTML